MENGQTQLVNEPKSAYVESLTTTNLDQYNKLQIERFDIEAEGTPVTAKTLAYEPVLTAQSIGIAKTSIDEIYFEPTFTSLELQTALRLLAAALTLCDTAITEIRAERPIASDDAVTHIYSLLPELFCCRGLSESFAAILNSIHSAFLNNRGMPLPETKLLALREIISAIRNEPFMNFDKAVDRIMVFEDKDFEVEAIGMDLLAEFLND